MSNNVEQNDALEESKVQQLERAKAVIAGSVPLISTPISDQITVSRGLYRNGEWYTTVHVKELTGADEEALARVKDGLELLDAILASGTSRVGEVDLTGKPLSERQGILGELLLGERTQILLAIVQQTYGDNKTIKTTCDTCAHEQEIDLILSEDFKAKPMDNPYQLTYSHVTSKGDTIEYRLATGNDQTEAVRKKGITVPEQNTIILSRCITSFNGGLVVDPLRYARSLSMKDRSIILNALVDNQPNVDLTLDTVCLGCGGEQHLALGWMDLFQP